MKICMCCSCSPRYLMKNWNTLRCIKSARNVHHNIKVVAESSKGLQSQRKGSICLDTTLPSSGWHTFRRRSVTFWHVSRIALIRDHIADSLHDPQKTSIVDSKHIWHWRGGMVAREGGDGTSQEWEALEGKNETEAWYKALWKRRRQGQ